MITLGTATVVLGWTLAIAAGTVVLGFGLFALSMWSNRVAARVFQSWDLRKAAALLVGDIHRAHSRYRAGIDITAGARCELP